MSDPAPRRHASETPVLPRPSLFWRATSAFIIVNTAILSRTFLLALNKTNVHGLDGFLGVLESRADQRSRTRGLLTVSNHVAVIDEPLIWGVLPISFTFKYLRQDHRWALGAHDIVFRNPWTSTFFTLGQTLPVARLAHNQHGGLFQPTMTEAVRLLSKIPSSASSYSPHLAHDHSSHFIDCVDPFSETSPGLALAPPPAYACFPSDRHYLAPSAYASNAYSWVHVFAEGMTHQHPDRAMRYFKWGVSRLVLEPPECPDIVPIFVEGPDEVMRADRTFPRFMPRIGKKIDVTFGDKVDTETVFGDLRKRWKELREKEREIEGYSPRWQHGLGLLGDFTMYGDEAVALRIECTRRIREEVLKVRRSRGYPDEDPKAGYYETWAKEGPKRVGKMEDNSGVEDV